MVDAESIIDLIPSKQKRLIPKLGDTNGAYKFESCPDCMTKAKKAKCVALISAFLIQLDGRLPVTARKVRAT